MDLARLVLITLCSAAVCSCASIGTGSMRGGWMGAAGSFEMSTDDVRWGFRVDGANLVLHHEDQVDVLEDFVPEEGLRYEMVDESRAHARFLGADGQTAEYRRGELTITSD